MFRVGGGGKVFDRCRRLLHFLLVLFQIVDCQLPSSAPARDIIKSRCVIEPALIHAFRREMFELLIKFFWGLIRHNLWVSWHYDSEKFTLTTRIWDIMV